MPVIGQYLYLTTISECVNIVIDMYKLSVDYRSKQEYAASVGTRVIIFEFWTVQGELKTDCVPISDEYNLDRLRNQDNWIEVGWGTIISVGARIIVDIEGFERTSSSPKYPYGFRRYKLFNPYYLLKWYINLIRDLRRKQFSIKEIIDSI